MHKLRHLHLEEIKLPAGQEWMDPTAAWRFVRVHSGAAYWLGKGQNRPLAEGEVVVVAPLAEGLFRASQIGDVTLHGFNFTADMLCGFFTVAERHFFENREGGAGDLQFLPSTHPIAQQFAAGSARSVREDDLHRRVEALAIVAAVFETEMARHQPPLVAASSALDRFQKIIAAMPETELMNHSPEELARLCGCSPRHFNRLFQQHFGVSARARQTELRLLKARQLLAGSDEKVIHVAMESGYRNLSLFNALFKKRFGMTPSAWRKKAAKPAGKIRLASAVALVFLLFAPVVRAAETNAAPAAASAATNAPIMFRVDTYELEGNTVLPLEILTPIFKKYVGEAVTFSTIRQALSDLQMAYRARGYVTVSVALPQQQLTNGVVQVKVTEGRLVDVRVTGNRHFSTENILRALPAVQTNALLNGLVFQQQLDRANASTDRQIYPVVSPGPEPGTSALELRVKDRLPFHMHMDLNNYGTPGTPDLRMNLSGVYNNLWQRDHQFGAQYSLTPESLKDSADGAPDEIRPYDAPLIASYSAFYRMPLSPINGYPRQYSATDFGWDEVTHRFRPPPLTGAAELIVYSSRSYSDSAANLAKQTLTPPVVPPGGILQVVDQTTNRTLNVNEDIGARLSKPLPTLGKVSSSISFGFDFKNYRSMLLQTRTFQGVQWIPNSGTNGYAPGVGFTQIPSPPQPSARTVFTSVTYLPFTLDWSGAVADKFGSTAFDLSQSFNWAGLVSRKSDFQDVAGSTDADGNYYVVTASLTRDQKVWQDWGVRLHADGQWANQPLISNEQFGLGGNAGVRGYVDGRQYGDTGWRVQFEPHSPYLNLGLVDGTIPMLARLYAFVDYGQTISLNSSVSPGTVSLLGTGFGVDANIGEHWDFRLMLGVPFIGVPNSAQSDTVHVAFSLGAQL